MSVVEAIQAEERSEVAELYRMLKAGPVMVMDAGGKAVELRGPLREVMVEAARNLESGIDVHVVRGGFLTTQQAADQFGCSRPYFISLLEKGELPFERVGTHRRIPVEAFLRYKAKRDLERREGLREMTRDAVAWGTYDVEIPLEEGQSDE